jgi:O-antigen ligase
MGLPFANAKAQRAPVSWASAWPEVLGLAATLALTAMLAFLLGKNLHLSVAFVFGIWVVVLAVMNPLLLLTLFVVQLPLVPRWGEVLGVRVPDLMTPVALALALAALARALALRRRDLVRPRLLDALILLFLGVVWLSIWPDDMAPALQKHFIQSMLVPALFYFVVRWLAPKRRTIVSLLAALSLSAIGLSVVMLIEAAARRSIFYSDVSAQYAVGGLYQPGAALGGPTLAGAFLAAVLPLYLYFGRISPNVVVTDQRYGRLASWAQVLSPFAAIAALLGVGICLERAVWVGAAVGLLVCVTAKWLRARALMVLGLAVFVPLALWVFAGDAWLHQRVLETENLTDRMRMIRGAIAVLGSEEWRPTLGIGLGRFSQIGFRYMPAVSHFEDDLPEADMGRPIHNDYLNVAVETGITGAAAFYALVLVILFQFAKLLWPAGKARGGPNRGQTVDKPLIIVLLGAVLSVLSLAASHNTLGEAQLMALFWILVGLVVSQRMRPIAEEVPRGAPGR